MEDISNELYELTEYITKKKFNNKWQGGGLLGGEYGYGVDFENDTFMMHPFCWCGEEDCGWCSGAGAMPQLARELMGVNYKDSDRLPNFLYKPTKAKVWWYKYIGRGMEQDGDLPKNWLKKCKDSLD